MREMRSLGVLNSEVSVLQEMSACGELSLLNS